MRAPRGTGTVNVRVVTKGGTSAAVKADRFVFRGAMPVVTGLSPAYGPTTGGTVVTITGSGFKGATSVTVGGVAATKLAVAAGGGTITATTPAHIEVGDPFHVRVTTPTGVSAPVNADRFYFYAPATVTSVSPANGPRDGGTAVTITGINLSTAKNISQAVKFGGVPATVVGQPNNSTIVATVPPAAAGAGTVDVTVTTRAGTTAASTGDEFSYADTIAVAPAGLQDQSQVVGVAVGTLPSVVVKDALGQPVKGVTVTFAVTTGGGSVTSATATTPTTTATAITDVSGVATLRSWVLGPLAGANALTATADVPGLPVTFTATGLADVNTAYMTAVPGSDGQSATAGAAVAISPSVRVLDSGGNGVPNVSVTFTVTSGGGSATGTTVSTNASGIATVGKWVLGPAVGANTLQAAASVTGSPVTFTVHGTVGAATQILAVSDTDQSGIAGGQAPIPPSVVVEDANNNPVPGVSVTFAVDSGGGTVGGSPAVTNSSGIATVGSWKLGPGANKLTATAAGVSGSVAFTASAALIVTGADTVADLHIANGTSLGAAEAALPATVGISLSDGTSATANVTWNEGSPPYDGDTAGSYPFVGTLSPPDGVSNPNAVTAAVTVDVGAPTVTSADSITDVSVDNGTSLGAAKAALPATVGVTLSNGDSATVDVTWAQGSPPYSGGTAGSYPFIGTLSSLPAGVTNPSDVTAAVNVDVGAPIVTAAHSIADVAVDNGTSLGDAEAALPATVGITLSNGDSATADVTWNPGSPSYDGGTQGSYPFVGTLSGLPDGVTNPSGVTAAVTVDVGAPTVVGADSIADVAVDNGTSLGDAEAALPVTVGVSLSNGGSAIVDVTWAEGSSGYDGGTAGSYPFVGTLSGLPAGVTNPSGVTAAVNVDVGA